MTDEKSLDPLFKPVWWLPLVVFIVACLCISLCVFLSVLLVEGKGVLIPEVCGERSLTQIIVVKSIKASFFIHVYGLLPLRQSSRGQHWMC